MAKPTSLTHDTPRLGVDSHYCLDDAELLNRAEVAEWQTRRTQNPVLARGCGFKSHLR